MSNITVDAIIGEPEVLEDEVTADEIALAAGVETDPAWLTLKESATRLQGLQAKDGSVPDDTPDVMDQGDAPDPGRHSQAHPAFLSFPQCESSGQVSERLGGAQIRPHGGVARGGGVRREILRARNKLASGRNTSRDAAT